MCHIYLCVGNWVSKIFASYLRRMPTLPYFEMLPRHLFYMSFNKMILQKTLYHKRTTEHSKCLAWVVVKICNTLKVSIIKAGINVWPLSICFWTPTTPSLCFHESSGTRNGNGEPWHDSPPPMSNRREGLSSFMHEHRAPQIDKDPNYILHSSSPLFLPMILFFNPSF